MKEKLRVKEDTAVPATGWKELVKEYKANFRQKTGQNFPDDPMEQLWGAIGAVFGSWMAEKAVTYRRVEKITGLLGTAVNVVQMVFETPATPREPACASPATELRRENFLWRLPGECARRRCRCRHPHPHAPQRDEKDHAQVYGQLEKVRVKLETLPRYAGHGVHRRRCTLYMLQTRTGKRTPGAAFRIAWTWPMKS